jgi:tetratricopeptide (TPR) repeat protein
MSPEQVEGKDVDQKSDIYSLGIILYEMLTARVPFEGETPLTVGVKQKTETPKDPKEYNEQIPDDLRAVILKCLEKDKERRYQSAGEIQSALRLIEQGLPTTEIDQAKKKRQTSREVTITLNSKKILWPSLIGLAAVIILVVLWQVLLKKKPTFAQKIDNSIAVVSFENQTGNPELDHLQKMIPNLLITNLENTGLFYVATWERMSDLLRQIEKKAFDVIDSELGLKLCRREGIESIVVGSYAQAGNVFVTDIKILDVETRKLLKSASSTGEGIDSILKNQIDELSRAIAEGLGMAREKIDAAPMRIAEVSSASPEAYKYYLMGEEAADKFDYAGALKFYEKAVELDPDFAYAYRRQSIMHGNLGNSQARRETLEKAKSLSNHATEKERLFIEASYAQAIEDDNDKMLRIYQQIIEKYPREKGIYYNFGFYYENRSLEKAVEYYEKALELDPNYAAACNELGYVYLRMNRNKEAIELFERYVSIIPDNPNALDSLADAYFQTGQIDEALTQYMKITETYPEFYSSNMDISYIHALKEEWDKAIKWIDQYIFYAPSLVLKGRGSLFKGLLLSWSGRFENALKELDIASNLAEAAENGFLKAQAEWMKGCVYFDRGEYDRSRSSYKNFFDSEDVGKSFRLLAGICDGLLDIKQGIYDPAKSPFPQMKTFLSEISSNKDYWEFHYNYFKAEVLVVEKRYDDAINQVKAASPPYYYLFPHYMILYNYPALRDVSARAFLGKGNINQAIGEYEELVTFDPGSKRRFLIHPKYHFRLANLYGKRGDRAKAIEHYEKFLDLWKDADPGIAEVEAAKNKLAGLKSR